MSIKNKKGIIQGYLDTEDDIKKFEDLVEEINISKSKLVKYMFKYAIENKINFKDFLIEIIFNKKQKI